MKIYIYEWTAIGLICINIIFKTWRKPYRFLNCLFLPQPPATTNWFRRLFKNIEVTFLSADLGADLEPSFVNLSNSIRLIREI